MSSDLATRGSEAGVTARRLALAEEVMDHPEWSSREIYARALAMGLWPDDGDYDEEPERNKKRIRGLRQLGKRLTPAGS